MENQDKKYGDFQRKLAPNISGDTIIGVRVPVLRKLAKEITGEDREDFLNSLPHRYYEENILHSIILSEIKDYEEAVKAVDAFLPFVDNWAVCDTLKPKAFGKNRNLMIGDIRRWLADNRVYHRRFGLLMLMTHFLDKDFDPEYLEMAAQVKNDDYYISMMIAWYFATALAKVYPEAVVYIEERRLDRKTHNRAIQKAVESFRVGDEEKAYLKTLKIK